MKQTRIIVGLMAVSILCAANAAFASLSSITCSEIQSADAAQLIVTPRKSPGDPSPYRGRPDVEIDSVLLRGAHLACGNLTGVYDLLLVNVATPENSMARLKFFKALARREFPTEALMISGQGRQFTKHSVIDGSLRDVRLAMVTMEAGRMIPLRVPLDTFTWKPEDKGTTVAVVLGLTAHVSVQHENGATLPAQDGGTIQFMKLVTSEDWEINGL
ncbi:MAG: hypothetical protein KGO96_03600 [Elusimicrobia bacterium]|nr:hypothetical protein [Elusimicrobiota bacterium]MDE2236510.1 hypothetical protein [Elusimicrobiota bacterium]MDE2424977.1 hypothetical protein [Elusimicrobiota bacterium]